MKLPLTQNGQQDLQWLHGHVSAIDASWAENEGLDWEEAEEIVTLAIQLPESFFANKNDLKSYIESFKKDSEWDSGNVVGFVELLIKELAIEIGLSNN